MQAKSVRGEGKVSGIEVKKSEEKLEVFHEEKKKPDKKEEEEKNFEKMIENLSLNEEGKKTIYGKIKEMKDAMEAEMQERQKKLTERLDELKNKGKTGKKAK